MTFVEGYLNFDFAVSWSAIKYDMHPQHVERMQAIESKAIDFCGSSRNLVLLLEVKDFRARRIDAKERFNGPLAVSVAQKMRDSVAGVLGEHRRLAASTGPPFDACSQNLVTGGDVLAVLFLQTDRNPPQKRKALLTTVLKLLKHKMRWAGVRVLVVDIDTYSSAIPGLTVTSLPGAGGNAR